MPGFQISSFWSGFQRKVLSFRFQVASSCFEFLTVGIATFHDPRPGSAFLIDRRRCDIFGRGSRRDVDVFSVLDEPIPSRLVKNLGTTGSSEEWPLSPSAFVHSGGILILISSGKRLCFFTLMAVLTCHGASSARDEQPPDAHALLARARDVMGLSKIGDKVVHLRVARAQVENYQSDRTYPPFFSAVADLDIWFDPQTGTERGEGRTVFPGSEGPSSAIISDSAAAIVVTSGKASFLPKRAIQPRDLNAFAVIADWTNAKDVKVAKPEVYRDYPRIVLTRQTAEGEQRLFLDPKTGFPVKLDMVEPHYLWGQRLIEYVYSVWTMLDVSLCVPGSSFRLADGEIEMSETLASAELVDRKSAPELKLPMLEGKAEDLPLYLRPSTPAAVQVSAHTYLLSNSGYNEVVTLVGRDLYIFDATQCEERAAKDAELIRILFPGKHRFFVVVTDLAWPHVAGIRYWVVSGATIISHRAAQKFLQSVLDRRWTRSPDLLEKSRGTWHFDFVGVDAPHTEADGRVMLYPIDGIGSEVALMAYLPEDSFLWASDYIQTLEKPSLYAKEVWNAVQRNHVEPGRVAAEHLPITSWETVSAVVGK